VVLDPKLGRKGRPEERLPDAGVAVDSLLAARTRELHLIQSLGRRAAEARTVAELFHAAVSILQDAEELDLALVACEFAGNRELLCYVSRPFDPAGVERLSRLAGSVLGWPTDGGIPVPVEIEADDFDASRGPRTEFGDDDPVVVPVLRRTRPVACLVFLPAGRSSEAQLRLLFSAANQLGVHLDRILTTGEDEADRFRSMLDAMPQPVVLTDPGLRVVHANSSARTLLEQMGLTGNQSFDTAVERLGIQAAVGQVLDSGAAWTDGEARLDGDVIFSVSVSPFGGSVQERGGLVFVLTDVSESRRLQQRLAQSEKMSSLGQMISGTAHELNNPLSSVLGYVQLVQNARGLDDKTTRRLGLVKREAERCQKIVQNLLAFARHRPPEHRRLSLNEVIQSITSLIGYQLRTSGVTVDERLDPQLPSIEGDAHQLQQVFVNLLTNAMHAIRDSADGGSIRLRTAITATGKVVVEIHDDGPGIPEADRSRIFDPFFTTKGEGKGTGLGLAIVYGIIDSHGGTIEVVASELGGACFRLTFSPVSRQTLPEKETPPAVQTDPARPGRVLIVDDEPSLAQMLCEALARDGHRVASASDGRGALERLAADEYDLIITDIKMPGMDARALLVEIDRRHPTMRRHVILTTGDTVSPESEAFAEREGLELIHKPFDIDDLRARVRARLARRGPDVTGH
jgi:two-component system NtrC family sensor kinase